MKTITENILRFFSNRVVVLFIFITLLLYLLVVKLFNLQIVNGIKYQTDFQQKIKRQLMIEPPRGTIYDRNGVPLAINQTVYSVKIDPSINISNKNQVLLDLADMFDQYNQKYTDNFPITLTEPYQFTFNENTAAKNLWQRNMGLVDRLGKPLDLTASQCMEKLKSKSFFSIDPSWSEEDARKVVGLRSALWLKRFSQYEPITIALDVKKEVTVAIEENDTKYPGIYIDLDSKRIYPYGKYISNLIGYTGKITPDDIANLKKSGNDEYTINDIVGKDGLEKSFEQNLKGTSGSMDVEVNSLGRRISTINVASPTPGDKVFLTIDIDLQVKAYNAIVKQLTDVLVARLTAGGKQHISTTDALKSMINANNIPVKDIWSQPEGTMCNIIKNKVLKIDSSVKVDTVDSRNIVKKIITDQITKNNISNNDILLVMTELKIITVNDATLKRLKANQANSTNIVVDRLKAGEITPQTLNIAPCTGSSVVTDINTGSVLAAVTYPSYDNNQFVNVMNDEYFYKVIRDDPTQPYLDRPFMEPKAPGSTFKMITATAGLETGVITPTSLIYDKISFKDAGTPYPKGENYVSYGNINVSRAIEVSCNYFFYSVAFQLGNSSSPNPLQGINTLGQYMLAYGLGDRTGVEVKEFADFSPKSIPIVSSPEYKDYTVKLFNPNYSENDLKWTDGDLVRTAIGQGSNNYTVASMAKYIMTLGNGGTRYQFHLLDKIENNNDQVISRFTPVVEEQLTYKKGTLDAIYKGMLLVTHGSGGTAHSIFKNFPITVAGKTGTAEENINSADHASFASFSPFEKPEIATYTLIPEGANSVVHQAGARVTADIVRAYYSLDDFYSPTVSTKLNSFIN